MQDLAKLPEGNPRVLSLHHLRNSLSRPVDALPLDIFRISTGVLLFAYFFRTFLEAPVFSGPEGLIDHKLSLDIFWFTRMGLFQTWMDLWFFQAVFLIGCVFSVFLIVGYRVKFSAIILYLIAISTYRWNYLVMYVDDSVMHLLIFWMLVLPIGRTLTLGGFLKDRNAAWDRWKNTKVSGFTLRCFLFNLALLYVVAGLWKWTSPMWRDGTALYVVFKLPISFFHDFWGAEHLSFLKVFNLAALVIEPLVPLMFLLPKGNYLKYPLVIAFLGLHLGTVATLDIPFANLACAAVSILIFREELMDWIRGSKEEEWKTMAPAKIGFSGVIAATMVVTLTLAMMSSVSLPPWRQPARAVNNAVVLQRSPDSITAKDQDSAGVWEEGLGPVQTTFFGFLWIMGIAQQYQLFNWIDDRNYTVRYQILEYVDGKKTREIEPDSMIPDSLRGVLLRFYIHGITWVRVPKEHQQELRKSLLFRLKNRYCDNYNPLGDVAVYYELEKIDPNGGPGEIEAGQLMRFNCSEAEPQIETIEPDNRKF